MVTLSVTFVGVGTNTSLKVFSSPPVNADTSRRVVCMPSSRVDTSAPPSTTTVTGLSTNVVCVAAGRIGDLAIARVIGGIADGNAARALTVNFGFTVFGAGSDDDLVDGIFDLTIFAPSTNFLLAILLSRTLYDSLLCTLYAYLHNSH